MQIQNYYPYNLESYIFVLSPKDSKDLFNISNSIYESGLVKWCYPNYFENVKTLSNDPLYNNQYYLNNTGQLSGSTYNIDIDAPEAWAITEGFSNIRIAVIDEGVEDHEDLGNRVSQGYTIDNPTGY